MNEFIQIGVLFGIIFLSTLIIGRAAIRRFRPAQCTGTCDDTASQDKNCERVSNCPGRMEQRQNPEQLCQLRRNKGE